MKFRPRIQIEKRKVTKIFTHCRKHEDEYITIAALLMWGHRLFIGIKKATICLIKDTKNVKIPKDGLGVGVGRGVLDDHKGDGRHDTDCAFGILSKIMKLPFNKRMGKLLKEVRRNDLSAHAPETSLARMIKNLHYCEGYLCESFDEEFDDILFPVYNSILRYCGERIELTGSYMTLVDYLNQSMNQLSEQYSDNVILWCSDFCKRACYDPKKQLTDIGSALRIYQRTHGKKKAKAFAMFVISGLCYQRQMFTDGVEILRQTNVTKIKASDGSSLNAFVVESDNPTLIRSFRIKEFKKLNVQILIQRKSSGHTQIFSDSKKDVNINGFHGKLTAAEKKAGGNGHWYNHLETNENKTMAVLNGSQSYPDVPATVLDLQKIIKVLAA